MTSLKFNRTGIDYRPCWIQSVTWEIFFKVIWNRRFGHMTRSIRNCFLKIVLHDAVLNASWIVSLVVFSWKDQFEEDLKGPYNTGLWLLHSIQSSPITWTVGLTAMGSNIGVDWDCFISVWSILYCWTGSTMGICFASHILESHPCGTYLDLWYVLAPCAC